MPHFALRLATASLLLSCVHSFSAPGLAMPRLGRGAAVCSVASRVGLAPAPARSLRRSGAASVGMGLVDREVITEGDGKTFPQAGDTLSVHYEGTLARGGTKFDSSYDRGAPLEFVIGQGQVIKGWDQGMLDMSLGEKATLKIVSPGP